ncbi:tRNA pseudouridine(55) synthase TruB [Chloroflexota bacterium]
MKLDGILNINKPLGKTSFSVVALVRQLTGERRVGHAGTLDPAATGVLPVCLGQGTRVTQFLMDATKCYRAEIELGVTTDTYDAWGKITDRGDPSQISQEQLLLALTSFTGEIQQVPPMYSAVKHRGRRLYELARRGINVERKSRLARIHSLQLIDWRPPVATIELVCGKGTYIRSLAHDLGQALGCGAIVKGLVRSRCGPFNISDAVSVPQLEDAVRYGYWQNLIYPIDTVLLDRTAIVVSEATGNVIKNGCPVTVDNDDSLKPVSIENRCRAYTDDGSLIGVLRFNRETGQWQPEKVFL